MISDAQIRELEEKRQATSGKENTWVEFVDPAAGEYAFLALNAIPDLIARLRSAEDALKFYAAGEIYVRAKAIDFYTESGPHYGLRERPILNDNGNKARAHFERLGKGGGG